MSQTHCCSSRNIPARRPRARRRSAEHVPSALAPDVRCRHARSPRSQGVPAGYRRAVRSRRQGSRAQAPSAPGSVAPAAPCAAPAPRVACRPTPRPAHGASSPARPVPARIAHRLAAYRELLSDLGSPLAGTLERHLVRKTPVPTQGQHLLDPLPITRAHGAVLQPPELAAGAHDFDVQTSAVEALLGLRIRFECADRAQCAVRRSWQDACRPLRGAAEQTPHTVTRLYRHRPSGRRN